MRAVLALGGAIGALSFGPPALAFATNDDFSNATAISSLPFTTSEDVSAFTSAGDDPNCSGSSNSAWFSFTAGADMRVEFDTVGSDTNPNVGVYTGTQGNLTELACTSPSGFFDAESGTTYFVMVANGAADLHFAMRATVDATLGTVTGRFYPNPTDSGAFTATSTDTPDFTQNFPVLNFNPPTAFQSCSNATGVDEATRPFTDVIPQLDGTCTKRIAQGNGEQAGLDSLFSFEAAFTGTLTVPAAGATRFAFFSDDGWILGIGSGPGGAKASYISGALLNAPARSPIRNYKVVGAYNDPSSPTEQDVLVSFPAAGTYPVEIDYTECCSGSLTLVLQPNPVRQVSVTKSGAGTGTVTSDPAGIDCGATCQASFPTQAQVLLTATADGGSHFVEWSGFCVGNSDQCTLFIDGDKDVDAKFAPGPPLTLSDASPAAARPGAKVTLTGTGFNLADQVTFNGVAANLTIVDDSQITTKVPVGALTGSVEVRNSYNEVAQFSPFKVKPVITDFTPTSGPPGTFVTITGKAFGDAYKVTFGGAKARTFTVDSWSQITAKVPATAVTGPIKVFTNGGTATSASSFTVP